MRNNTVQIRLLMMMVLIAIGTGRTPAQDGGFESSTQPVHYQQVHNNFNPATFA